MTHALMQIPVTGESSFYLVMSQCGASQSSDGRRGRGKELASFMD